MAEGRVKEVIVDSRINKILGMRTDSAPMLEALDAICEFYVSNTVEARRSLRQDLELQNINLAKKFLSEFDQVRLRIDAVDEASVRLENSCQQLASCVAEADTNMKSFMEKASELENQRNYFVEQSKEIGSFLNQFQLSNAELDILYRAPIDQPRNGHGFFDALQRLQTAYVDCKMMVERHCYGAGFELLEVLGQHQTSAYQRLFEWVKSKCDNLAENGSTDDIDVILQIAIRYLRKLPIYYSQCQDLIVNSRRSQLVQKFVLVLTQGGAAGQMFRAIDLHAHDPVRYVGDMLAWMHQTAASEEEFLQAIFGTPAPATPRHHSNSNNNHSMHGVKHSSSSPSVADKTRSLSPAHNNNNNNINRNDDQPQDKEEAALPVGLSLTELLVRCLQGLGRPLRVRIVQTLEARPPIETLYALYDLLSFYEETFHRIVPLENAVHSTVKGCLLECRRLFSSHLNKQAEALTYSPSSCPMDLSAAHSTKECTKQIKEILRVHDSSLTLSSRSLDKRIEGVTMSVDGATVDTPSSPSISPDDLDTVLGTIIQPLLQACRLGGQSLSQSDMAIFMLNNVSALQYELKEAAKRTIHGKKLTVNWLDLLQNEASTWANLLVSEETNRTLRRSDLDKVLELMQVLPADFVAVQQPGLTQDRVATAMRAFYASLFSTVAPQFDKLLDLELREGTRQAAAEAVAAAHAKAHSVISNPFNQYDKAMLTQSVEDVRIILGCMKPTNTIAIPEE